jgi:hypothetical protein
MTRSPSIRVARKDILAGLIQTAYLPNEIPPALTARHFAAWCRAEYQNLSGTRNSLQSVTHYERFSVPRETGVRRDLALVHPAPQLLVSLILTDQHQRIRNLIKGTEISRYDPGSDIPNFRAFKGISFRGLDQDRSAISRKRPFILTADISRFFYTIYTHSLEWAVRGKNRVKEQMTTSAGRRARRTNPHWTQELDTALGLCQSRETFGIPVGPDTSRIIAEVLLSGVHKEQPLARHLTGAPGYRLVDDFFLGFDTETQCRDTLTALRNALSSFNLQLNEDKTDIRSARAIFTDNWRFELIQRPLYEPNPALEAKNIRDYSELALYHANATGTASPVRWATRRLHNMQPDSRNFHLLLSVLLRFGRDFPTCIELVATFIINNKTSCRHPEIRAEIEQWLRAIFRSEGQHGHDFEVAWALVVCGALDIKISRGDFGAYSESVCSVVFAILGLLNERRLLSDPLSRFEWRTETKKSGLHGAHWLMFYESVRRKWTSDRAMISVVTSDPFMSRLVNARVTFLDDSIFSNVHINLARRRLIRIQAARRNRPETGEPSDEESYGTASL